MRGYSIGKDDYQARLRRIEGQVRGLQRMIDEDTYCIDVLTQISAVTKALQSVGLGLLDERAHAQDVVLDGLLFAVEWIAPGLRVRRRFIGPRRVEQRIDLLVDAGGSCGLLVGHVVLGSQPNRPET